MPQAPDTVVAAGCKMLLSSEERYAQLLPQIQSNLYYSNVVGDAETWTITFDVTAPV